VINKKIKILIMLKRQIQIVFMFFIVFFYCNITYAQKTFRRHFIIAYDASTGFNNSGISHILELLFNNERVDENGDDGIIRQERLTGKKFFEPNKDEISFYDFNLSNNNIVSLRGEPNGIKLVQKIPELFFKPQTNWTSYRKLYPDIKSYIIARLTSSRVLSNFNLQNLVYPLILNSIDQEKYAEENILIILTQNTPKPFNSVDLYNFTTNVTNDTLAVNFLKKQIDFLSSQFSMNTFDYPAGIFGYYITPKNVNPGSLATTVAINSDIKFSQDKYNGNEFTTSPINVKFPNNESLTPVEITLTIRRQNKDGESEIFKDVIVSSLSDGKWRSSYQNRGIFSGKLMKYDQSNSTYIIPSLKIDLGTLNEDKDIQGLKLNFEIKSQTKTLGDNSLKYVFFTETFASPQKINYIGSGEHFGYIIILVVIIFLFILFLVLYGNPKKLKLIIHGYIDSFEKTDYRTVGKVHTPYKAWNSEYQKQDFFLIEVKLDYNSPGYLFNWNPNIILKLQNVTVPAGFELFLKYNADHIKEFGEGYGMPVNSDKRNKISFIVGIRQNNIIRQIIDPELFKFTIEAEVKKSLLYRTSELRENIDYKFKIGPDLGDVWVAFDPGTTGSCVAVGSTTDNIILAEDRARNKIIPSILVFEKSENYHKNGAELSEGLYTHGVAAEALYTDPRKYQAFQSIKKLLGFKDVKKVVFDNGNILEMTGKDLASLLVKGLFKDIKNHFNSINLKIDEYCPNGHFNPLRAVIAIPNNFTISKIQDIIDCVDNLNQFKEIRYVYEAEAVLFYYLSNFSRLNKNHESLESETILVFDMGGATINATVVTTNKILVNDIPKYDIDFLGKIGYGIGGDTIDYCLVKIILSHTTEFPVFMNVDMVEEKIPLADMAKKLKEAMVRTYYSTSEEILITSPILEKLIRVGTGYSITINEEESDFFKLFRRDKKNWCKLFGHTIFVNAIYSNVVDAVKEVLDLSNNTHIDKVIFSGRSTAYPMIRENVLEQIKSSVGETKSVALNLEESKTAVAKGACWYGINKNSVRLNHLKTNASFGFKKTLSADRTDVRFYELVEMGCAYNMNNDGIDSFEGSKNISDNFAFDGSKVNFYQIMGKDADKILSENQKHKFSKIATIPLPLFTDLVAMKVKENDEVECVVKLNTTQFIREKGAVSDQQIDEANEEHYTWIVN